MLLTRAPVAGRSALLLSPDAPRLACVKPAASVHPEPGSNSPLLYIFSDSFLLKFVCSGCLLFVFRILTETCLTLSFNAARSLLFTRRHRAVHGVSGSGTCPVAILSMSYLPPGPRGPFFAAAVAKLLQSPAPCKSCTKFNPRFLTTRLKLPVY